ncbi:MAG: HlyC/CorC family transporter [Alphaproteobacteria bacterium]|nr:HlyC/CorC family transporter [Alphaproteobacteria bacterium]
MADAEPRPRPPAHGSGKASLFAGLFHKLEAFVSGRSGQDGEARIDALLQQHLEQDRVITKDERRMLMNLLSFGELRVDDVMVPRADIQAVEIGLSLPELVAFFAEVGHSRLPVFRETLDDPVGIVHIKDVVTCLARAEGVDEATRKAPAARLKRDVLFVPRSMPALDLLVKMQTSRVHMALVIDEYGGTDGLVSLEDLVEAIVGDIEDEHDDETGASLVHNADGTIDADARVDIEELAAELGHSLLTEHREEDIDTLGGLVVSLVGRVPQRGEIVPHDSGLEFEILDADLRRLKRVRLHPVGTGGASAQTAGAPAARG